MRLRKRQPQKQDADQVLDASEVQSSENLDEQTVDKIIPEDASEVEKVDEKNVEAQTAEIFSEEASDAINEVEQFTENALEQNADNNPEQASSPMEVEEHTVDKTVPEQASAAVEIEQVAEEKIEQTAEISPAEASSATEVEQTNETVAEQNVDGNPEIAPDAAEKEQSTEVDMAEAIAECNPEQASDDVDKEQSTENEMDETNQNCNSEQQSGAIEKEPATENMEEKNLEEQNSEINPENASDEVEKGPFDVLSMQNESEISQEGTSDQITDETANKTSEPAADTRTEADEQTAEVTAETRTEADEQTPESNNNTPSSQSVVEDPIVEKLMCFLKDPVRRELEFSDDISVHERHLVHKFVQENGLSCESTGNNHNHKFVVVKSEDLDYGNEAESGGESGVEMEVSREEEMEVSAQCTVSDPAGDADESDVLELHSDVQEVESVQNVSTEGPANKTTKKKQFNPDFVNEQLLLRDLKLANFSGCYKLDNSNNYQHSLRNICDSAKVPLQVVFCAEKDTFEASVYINNKYVSRGVGKTKLFAKGSAIKTAVNYLQYKGLTLWNSLKLGKKFIISKPAQHLGDNKSEFKRKFEKLVEQLISNPNKLQIKIVGKFDQRVVNDWRRSALIEVTKQYKLKKELTGTLFKACKVNTFFHKFPAKKGSVDGNQNETVQPGETQEPSSLPERDLFHQEVVNMLGYPSSLLDFARKKCLQKKLQDETNVCIKLPNLLPIKLDKFQGVVTHEGIRTHKLPDLLQDIADSAGVKCEYFVKGPFDGPQRLHWRTLLKINNIVVGMGCSKTDRQSRSDCGKNAFFYLVALGLKIIFDDEVVEGQVKKIDKTMAEASSMRELFKAFLEDKNSIKMILCYKINQAERELFETLCDSHSLTRTFNGTGEIIALKNNSYKHNMELIANEDDDTSNQTTLVISKEDLSVNSSIRDHIENFMNSNKLHEVQFPDDMQVTQKELIDVLAEKHQLKQDVDSEGRITLMKDVEVMARDLQSKSEPSFFLQASRGSNPNKNRSSRERQGYRQKNAHQLRKREPNILVERYEPDTNSAAPKKHNIMITTKAPQNQQRGSGTGSSPHRDHQRGKKRAIAGPPGQSESLTKTFATGNQAAMHHSKAQKQSHYKARLSDWNNKRTLMDTPAERSGHRSYMGNRDNGSGHMSHVESRGSGMDFGWVSDVVSRAVNTAVKVNHAVGGVRSGESSRQPRAPSLLMSNNTDSRQGRSLLNPEYLKSGNATSRPDSSVGATNKGKRKKTSLLNPSYLSEQGIPTSSYKPLSSQGNSASTQAKVLLPTNSDQQTSPLSNYQSSYPDTSSAQYQISKTFQPYYSTSYQEPGQQSVQPAPFQGAQQDPYQNAGFQSAGYQSFGPGYQTPYQGTGYESHFQSAGYQSSQVGYQGYEGYQGYQDQYQAWNSASSGDYYTQK